MTPWESGDNILPSGEEHLLPPKTQKPKKKSSKPPIMSSKPMTDEEIQAAVDHDIKIMKEHWQWQETLESKWSWKTKIRHFFSGNMLPWILFMITLMWLLIIVKCDRSDNHYNRFYSSERPFHANIWNEFDRHTDTIRNKQQQFLKDIWWYPIEQDIYFPKESGYFSSNIVVNNSILTWSVSTENKQILSTIAQKLTDAGLTTNVTDTSITFSGDAQKVSVVNEILRKR